MTGPAWRSSRLWYTSGLLLQAACSETDTTRTSTLVLVAYGLLTALVVVAST